MKFKISKNEIVESTNILGKPLKVRVEYRVYRSFFFGLFRMYVKIFSCYLNDWKESNIVAVEYTNKTEATVFCSEEDAKELIKQINENPDKFECRL